MNDQRSKKILFNKSSLLSLKAELLKKQEEVQEKKHLPQHRVDNYKPPVARVAGKNVKDSCKQEKRSFKDNLNAVDTEELEDLRKSKLALEKKAELYSHLSDGAGNSELSGRFLVDFNTKKLQEPEPGSIPPDIDVYQSNEEDESEWTDFTDCLGRTRKCLKSDLELYIKRDQELIRAMTRNQDTSTAVTPETVTPQIENVKPLLVQKTNDYLQSLREKWEQKEQELLAKDKDIHYQDVLYDEARMHGVSYFSFSTDEAERQKQMAALQQQRRETLAAQEQAEQQRRRRDELLAARVAAARARQRLRAGLPPEDPNKEKEKDFTACLLEFLTQQKDEADAKAKEQERKMKEEQEKERQKLREAYVRDWDIGKEGVEGKLKKFREMTQEEYVEQQRAKRIDEFAPMQGSSKQMSTYAFDNTSKTVSKDGSPPQPISWSDVMPKAQTPPPNISDIEPEPQPKGLYFSSKKQPNYYFDNKGTTISANDSLNVTESWSNVRLKANTPPPPIISDREPEHSGFYFSSNKSFSKPNLQYKNFVKAQEPTPIDNEVSDDELEEEKRTEKRRTVSDHAEIAPPPTYDYYGPVPKKVKSQKPFVSDINEAYAQGAKSLERKAGGKRLPQHYDFTFD